jgi:hypothetical protein
MPGGLMAGELCLGTAESLPQLVSLSCVDVLAL